MGAKRPRHRSRPEAAARTGTRRGACSSADAGHGLSVSPAATPTGYAPGRSPGSRAGGIPPGDTRLPVPDGHSGFEGSRSALTVAGAAPVLHRLPVSVRSLGPPRGVSSGWARTLRKPAALRQPRRDHGLAGSGPKKTPRLRRRETGRQGEAGPSRVRLRQDRISVDGAAAGSGLFRGAAAQRPAA